MAGRDACRGCAPWRRRGAGPAHLGAAGDGAYWYSPETAPRYTEGQRFDHAGGGNVLFAGWIAGQRFDEGLAHGEDTDFFHRAALQGGRIVYSAEPVIYEPVPRHRATLRYQTVRSFYYRPAGATFTGDTKASTPQHSRCWCGSSGRCRSPSSGSSPRRWRGSSASDVSRHTW
jgi:hypothetical protein